MKVKLLKTLVGMRALLLIPPLTLVLSLAALIAAPFDPGGRRVHRCITRPWARGVLRLAGVKVRLRGMEQLREGGGPFVLMFNHTSNLDIPLLLAHIPLQLRFIAKAELTWVPVFGQAFTRIGHIAIDRGDRKDSLSGLKRAAADMKRLGVSVILAPEGTRSRDGSLLPFKKGGFVLAIESGLPLMPVTITGAAAVLPRGSLFARGGEVLVAVGEGIPTHGMDYTRRNHLMETVRNRMEDALQRNSL